MYCESVRFLRIICFKFLKPEGDRNDEFQHFKDPSMLIPLNDITIGEKTKDILLSC